MNIQSTITVKHSTTEQER